MPRVVRCSQIFLSLLVLPHQSKEVCLTLTSVINTGCFFPIVADSSCRYYMMPWLQRCRTNPVTAAYELFLVLIFFDAIFVPEE